KFNFRSGCSTTWLPLTRARSGTCERRTRSSSTLTRASPMVPSATAHLPESSTSPLGTTLIKFVAVRRRRYRLTARARNITAESIIDTTHRALDARITQSSETVALPAAEADDACQQSRACTGGNPARIEDRKPLCLVCSNLGVCKTWSANKL